MQSPSRTLWLPIVVASCGPQHPAAVLSRPSQSQHVFILTVDTLRADRLGAYGCSRPLTPAMDELAQQGTCFARAMTPMPCTGPSHASLFTGLYPLTHGLTDNFTALDPSIPTLAEQFRSHGFSTAAFFHHFRFVESGLSRGFDSVHLDESLRNHQVLGELERWLKQQRAGQRLFVWIHTFLPHTPYRPPAELARRWIKSRYDGPLAMNHETTERIRRGEIRVPDEYQKVFREAYDADVAFADTKVAAVLELLDRRGLAETSLVVFAGDHGESLEKLHFGKHSMVIRQVTLHVPLIFRGPGVPQGLTVGPVVELMDVFPTLLEYAGLPALDGIQGRSLRPLIHSDDSHVIEDWDDAAFSLLPGRYYGRENHDSTKMAVRHGPWKLVREPDQGIRLYHLELDPGEDHDRAPDFPRQTRTLEKRLTQWLESVPKCRSENPSVDGVTADLLNQLGYLR